MVDEGHDAVVATGGGEALAMMAGDSIDLVLLDLVLPEIDGMAVLAELRRRQMLPELPVVVVTALEARAVRIDALTAGAADFLTKPIDPVEVACRIRTLLEIRQLRERAVATMQGHLRELDHLLRLRFEQSPVATIAWDPNFRVMAWNPAAERLFGYALAEALGQHAAFIVPAAAREQVDGVWSELVARQPNESTNQNLCKDGRTIHCEWHNAPLTTADGTLVGVSSVVLDVTEREQAVGALRESEARFRRVVEHINDALIVADAEGNVTFANDRFFTLFGIDRQGAQALRLEDYVAPEVHAVLGDRHDRSGHREAAPTQFEYERLRQDGKKLWLDASVVPLADDRGEVVGTQSAIRDITERRRMEEMFRQSQKLEAIGQLAGGVAHDFNNILGVILGHCEMAQHQLPPDHPVRPRVDQIVKSTERAASLTRQLVVFGRRQTLRPKLLDLNAIIADTHKLLGRLIGEDIEVLLRPTLDLGSVKADPGMVEQVILNLAVNARDAMPKGGTLTLETANANLDEEYAAAHPWETPGPYVMLAVSDTGVGMDAETQRRIFEPFFTTKPEGLGTGLGLASAYGIVRQSGGHIWAYSEPGRGTTFKVYLPRVDEPAAAASQAGPATAAPGGQETILLVEDAETLREVIRETLAGLGYAVLLAPDGEEALALAGERGGPIDLLLTDVVMPKLGGGDLAKRLAALRPGLRVLYMSGYTEGAISHQGVIEEGVVLLNKPFTRDQLAQAVREALDRPAAAP